MISTIVSTRRPTAQAIQDRNLAKTVGVPHEYVLIDNSMANAGMAATWNHGITQARGNVLVFMHDDVYAMKPGWGAVIENRFAADPSIGIIGIAGTQFLFADKPSWTAAGRPFVKGRIVHQLQNGDFFAVAFSPDKGEWDVVACDGLFLAVRAELFQNIRFDDMLFDGEHFHDIDLCMQVRRTHRILVTTELVFKKRSVTSFDKNWQRAGMQFLEKYQAELPASCTNYYPDPTRYVGAPSIDLKGKAPQETIV